MSSVTISPSILSGTADAPTSLRDTIRLIWAASLGEGGAIGKCFQSHHTDELISVCRQIGADIVYSGGTADIFTNSQPSLPKSIAAGTSAIAARLAMALAFWQDYEIEISGPILPRKAIRHIERMSQIGEADFFYSGGKAKIKGPLNANLFPFKGIAGSYWLSPFALSSVLTSEETLFQMDEYSSTRPQFLDTLSLFNFHKIIYSFQPKEATLMVPGAQIYGQKYCDAQGDWRNASYLIGAVLCAGNGVIHGISRFSSQAERKVWEPFEKNGALSWQGDEKLKAKACFLPSVPLDPTGCPALLPLWMAMAVHAQTPISIGPLYPMPPKAIWQLDKLVEQLHRLGVTVERLRDSVIVHPGHPEGATVDAYGDARIAMALSIVSLGAKSGVKIENAQGVADIFPSYWANLESLGADVSLSIMDKLIYEKPGIS